MTEAPVGFRPAAAGTADPWSEPGRQTWREGWRVFAHPDFGPPAAPPAVPPQSAELLPPAPASLTPDS